MIYVWLCWDAVVLFMKLGLPIIAQSATFKKSIGIGLGVGVGVSAVYAAAIKESTELIKREVSRVEDDQSKKWDAHMSQNSLILQSLNDNIGGLKSNVDELKNDVHETKTHVDWLYRNEIGKNKNN